MNERSESDKMEEIMLPGFRFHPTDEELVGFYLKRKIQQRPISMELIKQLDIYKYDPWDLPKLATTGEKEWYFYCPRDRKYRNSARPNRVTGAGFWKATGTDRPIYSSEGSNRKCIGLKKSLVFYKGRAAKGVKTDWMMHEFRLPSLADSAPPKRFLDKSLPANDSWAICRIFKKTNSTAQRALSHSWVSPIIPEKSSISDLPNSGSNISQVSSPNIPLTAKTSSTPVQFNRNVDLLQTSTGAFSTLDFVPYKPINQTAAGKPPQLSMSNGDLNSLIFAPLEQASSHSKSAVDVTSILLNMSSSMLGNYCRASDSLHIGGGSQDHHGNRFSGTLPYEMQGNMMTNEDPETSLFKSLNVSHVDDQWDAVRSIGFPFSLPSPMSMRDAWKPNMPWDSSCPSEMSASLASNKCYT